MSKSYPKIYSIGTRYVRDIFNEEVVIEEKADGSAMSFGKDKEGNLYLRSKGAELFVDNPQKMFKIGVDYVANISHLIPNNTVFYCEYIRVEKHNCLKYSRVPKNNLMLFAVSDYTGTDFVYNSNCNHHLEDYASMINIEAVPILYKGKVSNVDELKSFLETESFLGGTKLEGIVIKNYHRPLILGDVINPITSAKWVREEYKEVQRSTWKQDHTTGGKWESFI